MTRVWEVRQISGSELEKLEREKAGLTGADNTGKLEPIVVDGKMGG